MMFSWKDVDWMAVGTGIFVMILLAFNNVKGLVAGRESAMSPGQSKDALPSTNVEVAGALIDTKRIDMLIAELGALTAVIITLRKIVDEHSQLVATNTESIKGLVMAVQMARTAVENHTKAATEIHRHAEEIVREMRELRNEMNDLHAQTKDLRDEMMKASARQR